MLMQTERFLLLQFHTKNVPVALLRAAIITKQLQQTECVHESTKQDIYMLLCKAVRFRENI